MKIRTFTIVSVVVFLGCKEGGELSRSKASDMISQYAKKNAQQVTTDLREGEFELYGGWELLGKMKKLQKSGFVAFTELKEPVFKVTMEAKIEPFVVSRGPKQAIRSNIMKRELESGTVKLLLSTRNYADITGMTKGEMLADGPECEVKAEVSGKVDISPIGSILLEQKPNELLHGIACFKRYDDGWRLMTLEWMEER